MPQDNQKTLGSNTESVEKCSSQERSERQLFTLLWVLVTVYVLVLLLSPPGDSPLGWLPGEPIWAIKAETLREIIAESLNFFFVLPILGAVLGPVLGISAPVVHPASEAFFNFAEAWIFMFLPLMLLDRQGRKRPVVLTWSAAMFLTNVFLIPYMAQRLIPTETESSGPAEKGWLARLFGGVGLAVGIGAIAWFCFARPEFGNFAARSQYFLHKITTDRVAIAFCVDLVLFWIFQMWLMGSVVNVESPVRSLRFIPFFGLALWLLA